MAHHYTKNIVQDEKYCSTCGKPTPHYVMGGRLGRCMNDHHPTAPPKEKPAAMQQDLFSEAN